MVWGGEGEEDDVVEGAASGQKRPTVLHEQGDVGAVIEVPGPVLLRPDGSDDERVGLHRGDRPRALRQRDPHIPAAARVQHQNPGLGPQAVGERGQQAVGQGAQFGRIGDAGDRA